MSKCIESGCRSLEWKCSACGRVASTAALGQWIEWIDREKEFPEDNKILVLGDDGQIFICELLETKWGNHYQSTDWGHIEHGGKPVWTHWMPLPEPTKEK